MRLTSLTVDLVSSAIHVHGTVHVRNTGALIPDLNFSFDADVTLSINSQGDIAASVGAVSVDLNDWYADIVNFLSGGAFINTISAAIQDAMRSNVSGGFSGIVTPSQLLALVSLGAPSSLDIDLVPRTISVSTQGVAVQGDLLVEPQNLPPEAAFRVLPFDSRHFVFNAVESTAPGGTIHQYRWKHADGSTEVFSNTSVRFVTEKTFGRMRGIQIEDTCLTVVDDRGRTAQTCIPPLRLPQPREDSLLLLGISRRATTGSAGDALLLLTPNANNPVRD